MPTKREKEERRRKILESAPTFEGREAHQLTPEELTCHDDQHVFASRFRSNKKTRCQCGKLTWAEYRA